MRIFVAGATGVVGRRAVPLLLAAGHRVTASGRNPERCAALAEAGARVIALDLFDRKAVRRAVDGHDIVVNLATHMPSSALRTMLPGAFRENDRVRREGAANLAEAAIACGAPRLIQESFAPIYADGGAQRLDETAPVRPAAYNRTVLDAERAAQHFGEHGGTGVVLRFALFYGADSSFLRDMVGMVRRGIAPVPGPPDAYLSSVSHDDAARAVVAALDLAPGIYNVCDDEPLTRRDYFAAFADAFELRRPKPMPAWATKLMGSAGALLARSQRMSNRKLRASGWAPVYPSAREGLRAAAEGMRSARGISADQAPFLGIGRIRYEDGAIRDDRRRGRRAGDRKRDRDRTT
ncbi:MAG TPA: NAD(P)-dependent oxidoreductase [Longimicrobiales bacterium]